MDSTLNVVKATPYQGKMNRIAWEQTFSLDGDQCPYCPHGRQAHIFSAEQPHFYRKATQEDIDANVRLWVETPADGDERDEILLRRMVVKRDVFVRRAYCGTCADEIGTAQVLCYNATAGIGERVGV